MNYNEYSLSTCNWHQLAISIKVLQYMPYHVYSCLWNSMEHTRWFLPPPCRTSGVASTKKRLGLRWSVCPKHVETCRNCLSWLLTPAPSALETKVWDAKARCVIPPARLNHRNCLNNVTKMPRRSANVLTNLANGQTGILPLAGRRTSPSGLHRYYHCTCIDILSYMIY